MIIIDILTGLIGGILAVIALIVLIYLSIGLADLIFWLIKKQ